MAALNDFLEVGIHFGLDIVVLANVPVKFNFHRLKLGIRRWNNKGISRVCFHGFHFSESVFWRFRKKLGHRWD